MQKNMNQGRAGGPNLYQDGAVYSGWEKVRMYFKGSSNPKEITWRVVLIAVAVVLAVLIAVSLLAGKDPKPFPHNAELLSAIGQNVEVAAQIVGIDSSALIEKEPGVYFTNCGFPIDGVAFDLYFYTNDGMLSGYAYVAEYQAEPKKAAKEIHNAFSNMYVDIPGVTVKKLQEELEKEMPYEHWSTGELALDDYQVAYMEKLENSLDWEYRVGDYVTRKAACYIDKGGSYDPVTQKVRLVYSVKIEPKRDEKA